MKTMSALVKSQSKPGLWMERVSVPDMGDNDVMIKPSHVAICGTDVHIYQWDKWSQDNVPVPNVLGHEYVGEVVAIGSQVTSVTVGERVSGEGHPSRVTNINTQLPVLIRIQGKRSASDADQAHPYQLKIASPSRRISSDSVDA